MKIYEQKWCEAIDSNGSSRLKESVILSLITTISMPLLFEVEDEYGGVQPYYPSLLGFILYNIAIITVVNVVADNYQQHICFSNSEKHCSAKNSDQIVGLNDDDSKVDIIENNNDNYFGGFFYEYF